jgi:hypothetical protein
MTAEHMPVTTLVPVTTDDAIPAPAFTGVQMARAFASYRDLQRELDATMPDQLQTIGDRQFRKKGYWRAIAVAFDLTVEPVTESREVDGAFHDGHDNFGYLVTYRASTNRGRSMVGDGACYAIEKAEKFRCPHPVAGRVNWSEHYPPETCPAFDPDFRWRTLPSQASVHNVRSHAHTRAFNRAVSNLVGFGEVSAEEVDTREREEDPRGAPPRPATTRPPVASTSAPPRAPSASGEPARISEPQRRRLFAVAREAGWTEEEVRDCLTRFGFAHADLVTRDTYDRIIETLKGGTGA